MSRPWITTQPDQAVLDPAPAAITTLLPADHAAFEIRALVEELDLAAFTAAYRADGQGRPPYDPKSMLALIFYCRHKGTVSAGKIAAACIDDLGARLIMGNRVPHRSTIDTFLKVHSVAIKALLPQTLKIGHAEGLVDVSLLAGDGTYVQANAAMGATVDQARLETQIGELQQQLAAAEKAWAAQVATVNPDWHADGLFELAEPGEFGLAGHDHPDRRPTGAADPLPSAWRKLRTLANLLESRKQALAWLQEHPNRARTEWHERLQRDKARLAAAEKRLADVRSKTAATHARREKAAAAGRKLPGSVPKNIDDHAHVRRAIQARDKAVTRQQSTAANPPTTQRVNTTDPTSAIMPAKDGGFDELFNVQALACTNQFAIAIAIHPCPNDRQALAGLLQTGRANLDAAGITDPIGTALFDAGYASAANFTTDLPCDLLLVATEKEARQTGRLTDETSTAAKAWQTMTDRLAEPANRALYKQRAAIIEPLFAQLFARFGRSVNVRGEQVDVELHLWAVTHNLGKIIRHRQRKPAG